MSLRTTLGGNALVTGAGSGIGRAVAIMYARDGIDGITIADVNAASLCETEKLIKEVRPNIAVVQAVTDVSNPESVKYMMDQAATLGQLNYAANVAGVSPNVNTKIVTEPLEEYERVQNVNAKGVFLCMQAELQVMLKQDPRSATLGYETTHTAERGSIVNVASVAGIFGIAGLASYVASKHACVGLSKSAAVENGRQGIRVNAVCPSYIDTPMAHNISRKRGVEHASPESAMYWAKINSRNPAGRLGQPEEVAEACVFFTSPRATFISGQVLCVDGAMGPSFSYHEDV